MGLIDNRAFAQFEELRVKSSSTGIKSPADAELNLFDANTDRNLKGFVAGEVVRQSFGSNLTISDGDPPQKLRYFLTATAGSLDVVMPSPTGFDGAALMVANVGTNAFDVVQPGPGATIISLSADQAGLFWYDETGDQWLIV